MCAKKLGVGLNYQPQFRDFLETIPRELDFIEVVPDMFWVDRGPESTPRYVDDTAALRFVEAIRERVPIVAHGIGLSIGSAHRFNREHVDQIARWHKWLEFPWHSDHLAFHLTSPSGTAASGSIGALATPRPEETNVGITMPLPRSRATLDLLAARISEVVERIDAPFLLENNVYFIDLPENEMGEAEFLNRLCAETGCGLLLDLHNVYVNALNLGFDPYDVVSDLNLENVVEIHVAGGFQDGDVYLDSHSGPTPAAVWDLLDYVLPRAPEVAGIVFELFGSWYETIGENGLHAELRRMKACWNEHVSTDARELMPQQ